MAAVGVNPLFGLFEVAVGVSSHLVFTVVLLFIYGVRGGLC